MWPWSRRGDAGSEHPFEGVETTGILFDQMLETLTGPEQFKMTIEAERDLTTRLEHSARVLGLPEQARVLADRLVAEGFIREWFVQQRQRKVAQNTHKAVKSHGSSEQRSSGRPAKKPRAKR